MTHPGSAFLFSLVPSVPSVGRKRGLRAGDTVLSGGAGYPVATLLVAAAAGAPRREHGEPVRAERTLCSTF